MKVSTVRHHVLFVLFVMGLVVSSGLVARALTSADASSGGRSSGDMSMQGMAMHDMTAAGTAAQGKVRTYYIAADDVLWDYAPFNRNVLMDRPFNDDENVFVQNGPTRIGDTYHKALYRAYTDSTFKTLAPVPDDQKYLGLLGPVIRAEVGDTIKVYFKNNLTFPASIHPHGVFYAKDSEGAPYNDGTSGAAKSDDAVPPAGTHLYVWQVPERAGPGPMDGSSVLWMYHSHTDEIADTNAGLVGPMVITARGMAKPDGSPIDVDQEIFSYFSVINENQSELLQKNLDELAQPPHQVAASDEEGFEESNLMHSINGFVYGNGPMPVLHQGSRVRWYTFSLGTEVDLHTPHWHGNTVTTAMGQRTDMVDLLPGMMMTSNMRPDDLGIWMFHCHVNDHIAAGMSSRYRVIP